MALVEPGPRHRDALPSINHLALDKMKPDGLDPSRFPIMAGLNISTAALAGPATIYSAPAPLPSYAPSIVSAVSAQSGYISPSDPPRQVPNTENPITIGTQSLPSISEALGTDRDGPFAPPISTSQPSVMPHQQLSTPSSAIGHVFSDAPSGPSNPFSQSPKSALSAREQGQRMEPEQGSSSFTILNATEPRPQASQIFGTPRSPRFAHGTSTQSLQHNQGPSVNGQYGGSAASPSTYGAYKSPFAYTPGSTAGAPFPPPLEASRPPQNANIEEHRSHLSRSGFEKSYGDSVKRHLDVFDAQMTLEEIVEVSAHTLAVSRLWAQQVQNNSRSGYSPEVLPELHEIDDVLRQSNRAVEQLSRLRDAVVTQQQLLADQRARALKSERFEDEFHGYHDDYKGNGGFAGGDGKKRRGKAAPPGRCHSCNRAETPEWRRGPDGARTLCNACGLHYAKLTRKMSANKASNVAGSSLRPKSHDARSPIQ